MPLGQDTLRFFFCAVLVVSLIAAAGSAVQSQEEEVPPEKGVILDEEDWHKIDDTKIFNAHRTNPNANDYVVGDNRSPEERQEYPEDTEPYQWLDSIKGTNRDRVDEIQKQYDFTYDTTFPVMEYPENEEYKKRPLRGNKYELAEIYRYAFLNFTEQYLGDRESSNRTANSPATESGDFVKDAHATIVGIPGSATFKTDLDYDGTRIVPEYGHIYMYNDYRVEVNESTHCERKDEKTRICREEKLLDHGVSEHYLRFLTDEAKQIRRVGGQSGIAGYCCIRGYGRVSFTAVARPFATVRIVETEFKKDPEKYNTTDWVEVSRSEHTETETLHVSDNVIAYRMGNMSVRQQVFDGPKNQINISFQNKGSGIPDGMDDNFAPFMWRKLEFDHGGTITNVWRVFSIAENQSVLKHFENNTQLGNGSTNEGSPDSGFDDVETIDGPVFPRLHIVPREPIPRQEQVNGRVIADKELALSNGDIPLHSNNVLSLVDRSETYKSFYLTKAAGEVTNATDIMGNEIRVNTSYWGTRPPIVFTSEEEGRVIMQFWRQVSCTRSGCSGMALAYKDVRIDGGVKRTGTTDENGFLVIEAESPKVTVHYDGWDIIGFDSDIGEGRSADWYHRGIHAKIIDYEQTVDVSKSSPSGEELFIAFMSRLRIVAGFLAVLIPIYWTAKQLRN